MQELMVLLQPTSQDVQIGVPLSLLQDLFLQTAWIGFNQWVILNRLCSDQKLQLQGLLR